MRWRRHAPIRSDSPFDGHLGLAVRTVGDAGTRAQLQVGRRHVAGHDVVCGAARFARSDTRMGRTVDARLAANPSCATIENPCDRLAVMRGGAISRDTEWRQKGFGQADAVSPQHAPVVDSGQLPGAGDRDLSRGDPTF